MKRRKRIAIIRRVLPEAERLAQDTAESHDGLTFHGTRDHMSVWYATPFMMTRDADALEESNFTVIRADLEHRFAESVELHHFGHWACGWFDRLYVRADDPLAILAVAAWQEELDVYPIADEGHYADTEWEHNHPNEHECYSDDHECPCEVSQHKRNSCARAFLDAVEASDARPDDDGEWYCETCGEWYGVTPEDLREMDLIIRNKEQEALRGDLAEQERNGQSALPL